MFNIQDLVGKTMEEVMSRLEQEGIWFRLINVDGVPYIGTADFHPDRANLYVENGVVTKIVMG